MNTGTPEDFWDAEDFEDIVAATLIACFETKVKKNRGSAPADRLTDERVSILRANGPYIASNSRLIQGPSVDGKWAFDIVNDPLPMSGILAMRPVNLKQSIPGAYLHVMHVKRAAALGKYWKKRKAGTLYEMLAMSACNDGIHGERRYFTVGSDGEVLACDQAIVEGSRGGDIGARAITHSHDASWLDETSAMGSIVLQFLADKRFCWSISAQEKTARAHLGCMQEEVKSLLYARSLPMSATGRKRPILHLVEAHKRRMRNGTDVDVSAFLRGQQQVEIGGTLFRVNPPATLRCEVSGASQKRFFDQAATS